MFSIYKEEENELLINGKRYSTNLAFDNVLNVIDLLSEKKRSQRVVLTEVMFLLFGKNSNMPRQPMNVQLEAVETFLKRISPEKKERPKRYDLQGNELPEFEEDKKQGYSLKYDAPYIYAAFYETYGIDLSQMQGTLHWDKFQALLSGLSDETKFKQIVKIRLWKKPPKKINEAAEMKKLQEEFALPNENREGVD